MYLCKLYTKKLNKTYFFGKYVQRASEKNERFFYFNELNKMQDEKRKKELTIEPPVVNPIEHFYDSLNVLNIPQDEKKEKELLIEASVVVVKIFEEFYDDLFHVLPLSFDLTDEEARSIVDSVKEKLSHSEALSSDPKEKKAKYFDSQRKEVRDIVRKLNTDILRLQTARVVDMIFSFGE
uniref:Uncharacterized protein n=1 Tax=Pithovirus LCPAC304 TaxID=2506594 RepID=A0A481Z9C1_9VIRU|nr:MAG: hypothetical protein LCPAC304_03250 [Pithovirus LCPAC304]